MRLNRLRQKCPMLLEIKCQNGKSIYLDLPAGEELQNLIDHLQHANKNHSAFRLWRVEGPDSNLLFSVSLGDIDLIKSFQGDGLQLFLHGSILTLTQQYNNYRRDLLNELRR